MHTGSALWHTILSPHAILTVAKHAIGLIENRLILDSLLSEIVTLNTLFAL